MYSGSKYLQNPSKNHKCDDNFVPFKCLKQENSFSVLVYTLSLSYGLSLRVLSVTVMPGCHKF